MGASVMIEFRKRLVAYHYTHHGRNILRYSKNSACTEFGNIVYHGYMKRIHFHRSPKAESIRTLHINQSKDCIGGQCGDEDNEHGYKNYSCTPSFVPSAIHTKDHIDYGHKNINSRNNENVVLTLCHRGNTDSNKRENPNVVVASVA